MALNFLPFYFRKSYISAFYKCHNIFCAGHIVTSSFGAVLLCYKKMRPHKSMLLCVLFLYESLPHYHHHLSRNRVGRLGTTDDFSTRFIQFSLLSIALWNLANSKPVCSLMLSSHLFLSLPCLLPPFTVPCKVVLARPDERET